MCIHRDSHGDLHFSLRDNKNLGVRGTLTTPLEGEPVYLSLRPNDWYDLSNGSIIHFCPQAPPPTAVPGPNQAYDAFKYSLHLSHIPDPTPMEPAKTRSLMVIFPDAWIGVLMGTEGNTLHYLRRRYCCIITVSTRGQWHPDVIDLQGRTVMFCAPGKLLDELFDELFKQIASKFGSAYISQFMIIIPTNVAGRICGFQGSRFKSWTTRWQLQLDLRSSVVGNERLLVTRGTSSALNSFMFSFLETVDSCWQYDTGMDYEGNTGDTGIDCEGTARTKRRLENSARAQSAGKRQQPHQAVRVQSHA